MHLGRIGEQAPGPVAQDRVILPASLPQLVADLHIFVGNVVAVIVRALAREADVLRAAVKIGGDDVPACAPLGQMIEGRETAGECVRMLEGKRRGEPEAEIFSDESHSRHKLQRIVHWNLRRVAERRVEVAAVDVVNAKNVGDEKAIELAALQNTGEFDPIPCSTAACMICANGPIEVGRSNSAANDKVANGCTSTLSSSVVPEPVVRWPKPLQSSTIVIPLASRGTKAIVLTFSSSLVTTATQWANSTPVE